MSMCVLDVYVYECLCLCILSTYTHAVYSVRHAAFSLSIIILGEDES